MHQRPQQRRQLNQLKSNSAFLNHSQQMPPPPPPPQQFTHRRPSANSSGSLNSSSNNNHNNSHPPSHIHRPPPRSPGDTSFGSAATAVTTTSATNLYAAAHHQPSQPAATAYPAATTYPQQNLQNHYGEVRRKPIPANRGGSGGISCGFFLLWTCLLAGGGWIYFNYFLLPGLVHDVTKEEVEHTKHHWMTKYHNLQLAHETLEKSHVELKQTAEAAIVAAENAQKRNVDGTNSQQVQALSRELEEVQNMLQQERTWAGEWKQRAVGVDEHANFMKQQIQEYSKRRLIQKYGYRQLSVELELNFGGDDSAWITIDLAPIDDMPHAVFTFLEQVELGLYDDGGYAFHHNGEHIIMGAPVPNQLTPPEMDPAQRFADSGVASVLFQEYSQNMPHQAYTVGFAGRPGGPNFYFNTQDNVELHGPEGYAEDGSADPCFGRVTRGTDIIDRMHSLTGTLERGDWKEMNPFVAVRWIKILY